MALIRRYLSHPRIDGPITLETADIVFLRSRFFEVENQLIDFENRILELRHDMALIQNILSPVRRAPAEILSKIFEHYCFESNPYAEVVRSTCIISSVCVAWRNTAHATPQLWSSLILDLHKQPNAFKGNGRWVKEWLSRSRSLPLDLDLRLNTALIGDTEAATGAVRLFKHVLDFCYRIRSLTIMGNLGLYLSLFRLPRSSFPILEELSLEHFSMSDWFECLPVRVEAFMEAPKLQSVSIGEFMSGGSLLELLAFPVDQLTVLNFRHVEGYHGAPFVSPSIYLNMINLCSNRLVELKILLPLGPSPGFSTPLFIHLPALTSLETTCHTITGEGKRNLLHCISAPHLENLTIKWEGQDIDELAKEVVGFQKRSQTTTLSSLTLTSFQTKDLPLFDEQSSMFTNNLIAILTTFPLIQSFNVLRAAFDLSHLIRALIHFEPQLVLLPKLTDLALDLRSDSPTRHYVSDVMPMVLVRWAAQRNSARLQRISLAGFWLDTGESSTMLEFPGLVVDYSDCPTSSEFEADELRPSEALSSRPMSHPFFTETSSDRQ